MTIRERIKTIQNEISKGNLHPTRSAQILSELSALYGNVNEEITTRQLDYQKKLLEELEKDQTARKAELLAQTTEEYRLFREAKDTQMLVQEMIRSQKYLIRCYSDEAQQSKHQ